MANITRSGKHYKPFFLEKDHPGRDLGEGLKPTEPKGNEEEEEEEDRVLIPLRRPKLMCPYGVCSWPLKNTIRLSWMP